MCENHEKQTRTFRDREFDSLVSEGVEAAQQKAAGETIGGQQSAYAQERVAGFRPEIGADFGSDVPGFRDLSNTAFAGAQNALREAVLTVVRNGFDTSAPESKAALLHAQDVLFAPYYKGRGSFAGARFLRDLEGALGGVTIEQVQQFAALAGLWSAQQLIKEVETELSAAVEGEADADTIVGIIQRGIEDSQIATNL